ncbi:hypothetical protein GUJ93_ZPchr0458g22535 [Zizania palustris]|uniref:Uncharacterized protein n=1 Tax=Zizania palustris TaxID=103762 RepID=A0A8J5RS39_ZIZPA|nr:hypothetical protein GUJ93_ZPchr0458g22535 [Zizania palustris]
MEKNASQSPCISPAATTTTSLSAGESSWALDVANFMAYPHNIIGQEMSHRELVVSGSSGSSSLFSGFSSSFASYGDGDASFITSELMCDDDDSLHDTACSSAAAGSKLEKTVSLPHFFRRLEIISVQFVSNIII